MDSVDTTSQPEQAKPSDLAVHDSSTGPPDPVTSASALATDGDPSEAPTSAPPPRAPAAVGHLPAVDNKVTVKTTAIALPSAAAHAPVPRRVTAPPWTPGKKLTYLKAEEAKDLLRRSKVQPPGTKGEACTTSTPVNVGADPDTQDKIFEHGVADPSSAAAMRASSTPSAPPLSCHQARMRLFADGKATAPIKKQYKALEISPIALDDGMNEKATVTIQGPLVAAPQVFVRLASLDAGKMPTQTTVASTVKAVKSPDLFRACPAGTLTPSQQQPPLASPGVILPKPTLLAPFA
ncbi:hypothetical protein V8E36_004447 [Tilletia maclaganii]